MQRRELLRAFGAATALALLPHEAVAAWARVATGLRPADGLTDAQLALVGAISDTILPRTDTPSATDVGVPAFVNVIVTENYSDADRAVVRCRPRCRSRAQAKNAGAPFVDLDAERAGGDRREHRERDRPSRRAGAHVLAAQRPRRSRLFHQRAGDEGGAQGRHHAGQVRGRRAVCDQARGTTGARHSTMREIDALRRDRRRLRDQRRLGGKGAHRARSQNARARGGRARRSRNTTSSSTFSHGKCISADSATASSSRRTTQCSANATRATRWVISSS